MGTHKKNVFLFPLLLNNTWEISKTEILSTRPVKVKIQVIIHTTFHQHLGQAGSTKHQITTVYTMKQTHLYTVGISLSLQTFNRALPP